MAFTATVQLSGSVLNLGAGFITIGPALISIAAAVGQREYPKNLASGNNTITPPAGPPTYLLFVPPAGNTNTIALNGSAADTAGDTGFLMHKTNWALLSMDPSQGAFLIKAGAVINNCEFLWI